MSSDTFDPYSIHEAVRKEAWDFVGDVRSRANLPDPVFESADKLYYLETCVWDLATLTSAATYHAGRLLAQIERVQNDLGSEQAMDLKKAREQVDDMLDRFARAAAKTSIHLEPTEGGPKAFSGTTQVSIESGPVLFEFNAFLISARSALDYLARVLGVYIKGADFRSIHKLNKWLGKNHPDAAVTEFMAREWKQWIEMLKSYRDAVAHNVVLNFSASRELSFEDAMGPAEPIEHPVSDDLLGFYIYRTPPRFRYKVIGMEDIFDEELPIIETEIAMDVRLPDGTDTTIRHSTKRIDTSQVIPLEEYVADTLQNMERFVKELFGLLLAQRGQFLA